MPSFLRWRKWSVSGILTWSGLFLLVPFVILGLFAEMSLPGDMLYPMKRGIENLVLNLESFDKSARAYYQMRLASTRFQEANKLLTVSYNPDQLMAFVSQVEDAKLAVEALPAGPQKDQAKQQLISDITSYQQSLAQTQANLRNTLPTTTTSTTYSTTTQTHERRVTQYGNSYQSTTSHTQTTPDSAGNSAIPLATPTPAVSQPISSDPNVSITQTSQELEAIKVSLLSGSPPATPIPGPSDTPTLSPAWQNNPHQVNSAGNTQGNQSGNENAGDKQNNANRNNNGNENFQKYQNGNE